MRKTHVTIWLLTLDFSGQAAHQVTLSARARVCTCSLCGPHKRHLESLQRLKRSLSFKTVMRSKSVDNFFQRSNSEARLPQDLLTDPPPSPRCPNPSVSSHSPCLSLSPSLPAKPVRPQINHCFQDHVFRKPTTCQHCKNMIVGNSKQALRCKTCKMAAHLWCTSELSQQPCYGKPDGTDVKLYFSLTLFITEHFIYRFSIFSESHRSRVDPVYAALRYGTSLAQMTRSSFGSTSDSPTRSLVRNHLLVPKRIDVQSIHTYVALFKFLPQEHNDLELQPGDRVQVTDDSNEEWWKGKCGDRVGFFPANFVQRVRPGERVWRVVQSSEGNRGRGHMPVRESQICVGKRDDGEVFVKLSSGKKRGLVAAQSIEEI
uniref:SH3 and cysteine-rich domain-containing protein 2 n=1 Tax=Neogobius melanostomus TaxID=47308 RepID=A0A8C6WZ76_9GOBI